MPNPFPRRPDPVGPVSPINKGSFDINGIDLNFSNADIGAILVFAYSEAVLNPPPPVTCPAVGLKNAGNLDAADRKAAGIATLAAVKAVGIPAARKKPCFSLPVLGSLFALLPTPNVACGSLIPSITPSFTEPPILNIGLFNGLILSYYHLWFSKNLSVQSTNT